MASLSRILGHLIDCKQATRLISQTQDRPASGWEAVRLRWHLAVCVACTRFDRQVAFMREAMRRFRS
jgi:hypothetical protein